MFAELNRLQEALRVYINANYHLSHPQLVALRDELLRSPGALQQRPFIESTPRYQSAETYSQLDWLPPAARGLLAHLVERGVIFKRPYTHQAKALREVLVNERDLVITTGTGSGKTETFLMPILGRLAVEAAERPEAFKTRAVRALVLYPMNALVNDQLGRMRGLFGSSEVTGWFREKTGRPLKFARYTGKTLYPGHRREGSKHGEKLSQLKLYVDLEEQAQSHDPDVHRPARELIHALQKIGKWPSKPSATGGYDGMTRWFGKSGQHWKGRTLEDEALDPELLIRHEVQESPPDVLITNYSMLEYTLLRPIERDIFRKTEAFFAANPSERFFLILDESHLYRGSTGAEIGMLVRRLRARLGISLEQLQIISTSASFDNAEGAKAFVAGLSGKPAGGFEVLEGDKEAHKPAGVGSDELAKRLASLDVEATRAGDLAARARALAPLTGGAVLKPKRVVFEQEEAVNADLLLKGLDASLQPAEERVEVRGGRGETTGEYLAVEAVVLDKANAALSLEVGFEGEPAVATVTRGELRYPPGRVPLCRVLWDVLAARPVVGRLINETSGQAQDLSELPALLFPEVERARAEAATNALLELCPAARGREDDRPLLAARVHVFLRGLPGLWACTDPDCSELPDEHHGAPCGRLFTQPVRRCPCGARAFELYSCRACGAAFLNAWTDDPHDPSYLWLEDIGDIEGGQVAPISIALQGPEARGGTPRGRAAELELTTGKLYTEHACDAERVRDVWIPGAQEAWKTRSVEQPGWFESCPCCGAGGNRYPIQDHTTSGDDPFMEVTREQLMLQPARPEAKTPLKGRKVLIFSDGRQLASRLSGKLQESALRDSARPLLLDGLRALEDAYKQPTPLSWSYLAVLTSCVLRGVEPRPKQAPWIVEDLRRVEEDLFSGDTLNPGTYELARDLSEKLNSERVNAALMGVLLPVIDDPYTGLAALGLADVAPIFRDTDLTKLASLPPPTGTPWAKVGSADDARRALVQLWLQLMLDRRALLLPTAPVDWRDNDEGPRVSSQKGSFRQELKDLLPRGFHTNNLNQTNAGVKKAWLRFLYDVFGINEVKKGFLLNPKRITLRPRESGWGRCQRCSAVQPLIEGLDRACYKRWGGRGVCGGTLEELGTGPEPGTDPERIFRARKGLYRLPYERLQASGEAPHPFSSAPHTAALNSSGEGKAMGLAELYELRFQDIPVPDEDAAGERRPLPPIDILSVTTTMEVGIDIGSLTAVAMRNVPPGRANYQQRAGRAGRRGSALSLVATWCGADSHDQQFFKEPYEMVSGDVPDPKLSIHNGVIIRRHLYAALFSRFQLERVPDYDPEQEGSANIFESLGALDEFREGDEGGFSFAGMAKWLDENRVALRAELEELLPAQFLDDPGERTAYLEDIPELLLQELRAAGAGPQEEVGEEEEDGGTETGEVAELEAKLKSLKAQKATLETMEGMELAVEALQTQIATLRRQLDDLLEEVGPDEDDEDEGAQGAAESTDPDADPDERKLLDRLFAEGLLPRYAFPTSVVALHVFDNQRSDQRRAVLEHAPQRDLNQALSSYAPGREVWINGERHYSFAIWSPFSRDRFRAWSRRRLYLACQACGYAELRSAKDCAPNDTDDCKACGKLSSLGPAIWWMRPPGFAHPYKMGRALPSGASPARTRPTRAKLHASFDERTPQATAGGVTVWTSTEDLVITNTGANERGGKRGFLYCAWCGLAEPNSWDRTVLSGAHTRPNPDHRGDGEACTHHPTVVTIGNEFRSDVAVLRFATSGDVALNPQSATYRVVLKTLAVALTKAAIAMLDIEPSDIAGEYRVALSQGGQDGREVEVFLYDVAAGGAGFVKEATADLDKLLRETLGVLSGCPNPDCSPSSHDHSSHVLCTYFNGCTNPDCTSSCYQCLRSYKNKWDHADLNRLLAADFLRHCWFGESPQLDEGVEEQLLASLALELRDADAEEEHDIEELDGHLWLPDFGRAVAISHPLRPGAPGTAAGTAALASHGEDNTALVSQLVVERNLPLARRMALGLEEAEEAWQLPAGLSPDPAGVPVYSLGQFDEGGSPEPREHVTVQALDKKQLDPASYFVVHIDTDVMDRHAPAGSWVVFRRLTDSAGELKDTLCLLRRGTKPFTFTDARWAVGLLRKKAGGARLDLGYRSNSKRAIDELAARRKAGAYEGLDIIGEARWLLSGGGADKITLS